MGQPTHSLNDIGGGGAARAPPPGSAPQPAPKEPDPEKTTSMQRELEALGRFRTGKIIGNKWRILAKLDEGGFGTVYKVENVNKKPSELAALKVEPSSTEEGDHLKLETAVLKDIHEAGFKMHIPQLYRSAKRKSYCYMIITLLGDNLRKLKKTYFEGGMALRTWSRIGIQCLFAIKTMHDRGYVHRDIKATNFVLGYPSITDTARVVYIIDFGLARAYAFQSEGTTTPKRWVARKARANVDFRGTWRYASPTMHEKSEQGRRDDVWSFLYMMIDLYCGLPWGDGDSLEEVERKKMNMRDADLMTRMPTETEAIPKHLRSLDVYMRPNYFLIFKAFDDIRKRQKTSFFDPYEWETVEAARRAAMNVPDANKGYVYADTFMRHDPMGISGPPTAADEAEMQTRRKKRRMKPEAVSLADFIGSELSKSPPTQHNSPPPAPSAPAETPEVAGSAKASDPERKKRSGSEDSEDFTPSVYMNLAIPKMYVIKGANGTKKDVQKRVAKLETESGTAVTMLESVKMTKDEEGAGPPSISLVRGARKPQPATVAAPKIIDNSTRAKYPNNNLVPAITNMPKMADPKEGDPVKKSQTNRSTSRDKK